MTQKAMTPGQFREKMVAIRLNPDLDVETKHWDADKLMLELLSELGYGAGAIVFGGMERLYS